MAIKPIALQRGDTVGIVTLGSPLAAATINARITFLRSMGLKVVVGQHVYDETGFLAGTDQRRAGDLMSMFANDQVRLIILSRGGVGVAGVLPYLDYNFIRIIPRSLAGYPSL
jgi:muramoyltetrapeptide carboxypeptidase